MLPKPCEVLKREARVKHTAVVIHAHDASLAYLAVMGSLGLVLLAFEAVLLGDDALRVNRNTCWRACINKARHEVVEEEIQAHPVRQQPLEGPFTR